MTNTSNGQLSKWTVIWTITLFLFASCQTTSTEQKEKELLQKENELLKKENELLQKEKGQQKDPTQQTITQKNIPIKDEQTTYQITKSSIEQEFIKHLGQIEGSGRDCWTVNSFIGDLNGDGVNDGVAHFGCLIKGNVGNASGGSGIAIFLVNNNKLEFIGTEEDYIGFVPSKIASGVVYGEQLDYGPDDPRCCPSIKTKIKLKFSNNKLVKVN